MTTSAITTTNPAADLLAEFGGHDAASDVALMIGINRDKASEAPFSQYLGDKDSVALLDGRGRPQKAFEPVTLTGIDIAREVGEFKIDKLNLFLTSSAGTTVMITSILPNAASQGWFAQSVLGGLLGLLEEGLISQPFCLEAYKGNRGNRPVFGTIKTHSGYNGQKYSSQRFYDDCRENSNDRSEITRLCTEAVEDLKAAIRIEPALVLQEQDFTHLPSSRDLINDDIASLQTD